MTVMCITDHFNQHSYSVYGEVKQILLKNCRQEGFVSELKSICPFYKDDFNPTVLWSQLHIFDVDFNKERAQSVTILDIQY